MHQLDKDIALTQLDEGIYRVEIASTWNVHLGPNGGYIAAIIVGGMKQALGKAARQTRSVTFHFLSPSIAGSAELSITTEKLGKNLSTASARLTQGDRTIAIAMATFAGHREGPAFCDANPPVVRPPEQIQPAQRMGPDMPGHVAFRDHYDQRLAIGPVPPAHSTRGQVGGWTRFVDQRPLDDLAIIAISDSWYPSISAKALPQRMQAPTVDHTVHILETLPYKAMEPDDFLLVEFETHTARDGYLIEDGRMWAPDGTLLAESRQLAVLLPMN